jgi:hypothetical protein
MSDDHRAPEPGDIPNEAEVASEFPHAEDVPVREQRDLVDDEGDDIRQYTGEPVETELGTVVPEQMAVGSQRTVGGGEFPHEPPRGVDHRSAGDDSAGGDSSGDDPTDQDPTDQPSDD